MVEIFGAALTVATANPALACGGYAYLPAHHVLSTLTTDAAHQRFSVQLRDSVQVSQRSSPLDRRESYGAVAVH
jgi:hypothetical protein